jgi:ABC-type sugar transport system substrate-binding protein
MAFRSLALFLRALDNSYQYLQKGEFYFRAHLRGFSVVEYDAGDDAHLQLQQIRECLGSSESARPRALFVNPVRESLLTEVARQAVRFGIPWVSLNRTPTHVTDLRREFPTATVFCVDPDQRGVGRLQGQQFQSLLPAGGELFYVHGPQSTSSARLRLAGLHSELSASQVHMTVGGGDWSEESGFLAATSWLRSARDRDWGACVIGAQNDDMALGAYKALQHQASARKLPQLMRVRVTGCDGEPNFGQRLVAEGVLAATVVIPPTTGRAVDEVATALEVGMATVADVSLDVTSFPAIEALSRTVARKMKPKRPGSPSTEGTLHSTRAAYRSTFRSTRSGSVVATPLSAAAKK